MPKREKAIVVTATPDVEANVSAMCCHLGLDRRPTVRGRRRSVKR